MDTPQLDALFERMRGHGEREACWWRDRGVSYRELLACGDDWMAPLAELGIGAGETVAVLGDYSPRSIGLLLALMRAGAVAVPISSAAEPELDALLAIAGARHLIRIDADDTWRHAGVSSGPTPKLVADFHARGHPGLIVFTSGSTGQPKGILHDCERLLAKFAQPRRSYRTLLFLLFDHFGGFNTLLGVLSYGGTMVIPTDRSPGEVARVIEAGRVELLPVTPTFLNLLLSSGACEGRDTSSVALVTYGTEVMPEATLRAAAAAFPQARFQQTYGLSELGVLRSKSRDSGSLWVKIGGSGFETRVVDGILEIRSESAMVGYLNEKSPFDADGWMSTGDRVEQEGDYFRILGRESDVINVGGQKVFPVEVETVLLEADNVVEAAVFGEKHPLMGSVPMARVTLREPEDAVALRARLRAHCRSRLAPYKVPIRFQVADSGQHDPRFKKRRRAGPDDETEAP